MSTTLLDAVNLMAIIGLPLGVFLYTNYRNMKKDYIAKQEKLEKQVDRLEAGLAKTSESFVRIHSRFDVLVNDQQKLETAVEVRMDRLSDKLEKIYELLIEERVGK